MLASFSFSEKTPDVKEWFEGTDRLFAIQLVANFIIFIRILLAPGALLSLRSDDMSMD